MSDVGGIIVISEPMLHPHMHSEVHPKTGQQTVDPIEQKLHWVYIDEELLDSAFIQFTPPLFVRWLYFRKNAFEQGITYVKYNYPSY